MAGKGHLVVFLGLPDQGKPALEEFRASYRLHMVLETQERGTSRAGS